MKIHPLHTALKNYILLAREAYDFGLNALASDLGQNDLDSKTLHKGYKRCEYEMELLLKHNKGLQEFYDAYSNRLWDKHFKASAKLAEENLNKQGYSYCKQSDTDVPSYLVVGKVKSTNDAADNKVTFRVLTLKTIVSPEDKEYKSLKNGLSAINFYKQRGYKYVETDSDETFTNKIYKWKPNNTKESTP